MTSSSFDIDINQFYSYCCRRYYFFLMRNGAGNNGLSSLNLLAFYLFVTWKIVPFGINSNRHQEHSRRCLLEISWQQTEVKMVLGILTSIAACPAIIGTTEAVRSGQKQNAREKHRSRKANLVVSCQDPSRKARDIHGGTVVLRNNKVCSSVPTLNQHSTNEPLTSSSSPPSIQNANFLKTTKTMPIE